MGVLFTRTAVVPVWIIAFAVVFVISQPAGMAASAPLIVLCGLAAAFVVFVVLKRTSHRPRDPIDVPVGIPVHPPRQLRRQRWSSRW